MGSESQRSLLLVVVTLAAIACTTACAAHVLLGSNQAYVKASNTDAGDLFSTSVALSADGKTLAIGAPAEGSAATGVGGDQLDNSAPYSGAVYMFGAP